MTRIARVRRSGDAGITLTELVVGMALTTLALAMVGGFFSSITRSITAGKSTRIGTSIAMTATNELTRVIRVAATNPVANGTPTPAVVDGTDRTLTVISYVDTDPASPAPTQVSFAIDGAGNLRETRTAAQSSSGYWVFTGATTTRIIPGPISGTDPIFTYLDSAGLPVEPGAAGLTSEQEASIASISITVTAGNRAADPVQITRTAVMTNLTLS